MYPHFLKTLERLVRDIFFLHIFKQEEGKLKETIQTVFFVAHTLLLISVIILTTLMLLVSQDHGPGQYIFKKLDDFVLMATFLLLIASFLSTAVKVGAFEKYRVYLVCASFNLIVLSVILILVILSCFVFDNKWLLDSVVLIHG